MDRLNTTNQGGKHFTTDDLGFMQTASADAMKHIMYGLGLASQTFILYGCVFTPTAENLTVSAGAMSFMGEVLPVPEQTATGTGGIEKYWFVLQSQESQPRTYFNGISLPTLEYRTVKLVYSESQPAGGVMVTSVVEWSKRFYDVMVAGHIPTTLPANGGDADTLDGKHASDFMQSQGTDWVIPELGSNYTKLEDTSPTQPLRYRRNKIGNIEIVGSFRISNTAQVGSYPLFTLPEGMRPMKKIQVGYCELRTSREVFCRADGIIEMQVYPGAPSNVDDRGVYAYLTAIVYL